MGTGQECGLNGPRLQQMLCSALWKQMNWRPHFYKKNMKEEVEVGPQQRDNIIRWLARLNKKFGFNPETFALASALLDRFLRSVKARPKYLRCIGIACFYLAAKVLEESEKVPGVQEIVQKSDCGCSRSELLRMERLILDKLDWELSMATTLDFVHIFHSLLLCEEPNLLSEVRMTPTRQLALLTYKAQQCAMHHRLLAFSPATTALALISLELEVFRSDWFPFTIVLQSMSKVDSESLIRCREALSKLFMSDEENRPTYRSSASAKATKRKVGDLFEDDDLSDSIKRLYGEEFCESTAVPVVGACGREARQETTVPMAPLQAVVN